MSKDLSIIEVLDMMNKVCPNSKISRFMGEGDRLKLRWEFLADEPGSFEKLTYSMVIDSRKVVNASSLERHIRHAAIEIAAIRGTGR